MQSIKIKTSCFASAAAFKYTSHSISHRFHFLHTVFYQNVIIRSRLDHFILVKPIKMTPGLQTD